MIRRHPWLLPLLLAVLVLGCWYFGYRARNSDRELPVYVLGGERMAAGEEIYRRGTDPKPFTYPPFAAVPFVPFASIPVDWQPSAWFAVNFFLLIGIGVVLHRFGRRDAEGRGPPRLWLFWVLTLLFGGHHVLSVLTNQSHDLLIAGLLALTAATWCRGSWLAGVWAGVGAAIKATPLLFLGLFLVRLRALPLIALLAAFAALSLLPDLVFPRLDGQSWLVAWFDVNLRGLEVGGTASAAGAWNAHSYLNQGLSGTLTRLFTPAAVPGHFVDEQILLLDLGPTGCRAVTIAAQLAVLGLLAFAARLVGVALRTNDDPFSTQRTLGFGEVAAFACGMVLLSPQSSKAHFCIWLFPAAFLADRLLRGRRDPMLLGMMIVVLLTGPLASKGIVGRELGNKLLALGNVTWCTVMLLLATVRVIWTERRGAPVLSVRRALLALTLGLAGCQPPVDDLADGIAALPAALREVSGMVAIDGDTLACVQDEAGVIFFYDLGGRIEIRARPFGPAGDYEGIAYTGSDYWILRSDGALLQLAMRGEALTIAARYRLPKGREYEGLCYDADRHRLLALPKGPISGRKRERDLRHVFAFDLRERRPVAEPVMTLRLDDLIEQAEARGLAVPRRTTSKGNERVDLKLRGSELLVIPGTDELLLLSSTDHLLLRMDGTGRLLGTRMLDAGLLPQPEAMTFLADGRLLVASEGVRGPAVIAVVEGYR